MKTKLIDWVKKNKKFLSPSFFLAGFVLDNFTLTRIDLLFDNLILAFYLFVAFVSIFLINFFQKKKIINKKTEFLPFITQFVFGGLFSGYSIFYTKSASFASSWIFLLILYGLFVGNEKFKKSYEKIDFQISILFVAVFSFLIFFVPVILKKIGDDVFLISGFLALLLVFLFVWNLFKLKLLKKADEIKIYKNVFFVFVIFNLMYFLNIIPPVPLSMKEIGVYNYVEKSTDGNYILIGEKYKWNDFMGKWKNEISTDNGIIYVYSSIFAPTNLDTNIVYIWEKYNEEKKEWKVINRIQYPITGGRNDGYRGYSFISNNLKGKWKVEVENQQGQTLGEIKFEKI